ncbi:MAG TPA: hypothetical protein VIV58_18250, partial [Kofleriaceae bacterium]
MTDDAEPAPADSPREAGESQADADNAAAIAEAIAVVAASEDVDPAELPRAHLAHQEPERVPVRYLARILAAVWIGAALLYGISKLDGLTKTRSHIA